MSGRVLQRLAELGLELPPVVAPVAAYVPAVLDGDRVWTAGQVPMVDGALPGERVRAEVTKCPMLACPFWTYRPFQKQEATP